MTTPSKIKVCDTCRRGLIPETLCATCIGSGDIGTPEDQAHTVDWQRRREDEADRAHTCEQLATQLEEMERACVDGQAEIEALRARVGSLEALFKSANDDSALAWSTVGRICKALWVNVLERPEAEGVNRDHEEIVEEVVDQRDTLRARVAELEEEQARLKHLVVGEIAACGAHIDSLEKLNATYRATEAQHLSQDVTFPAECPKCQERTHPFYDVEQASWLCDRCHHPAGEPFVHADTEGGEG